MITIRNMLEMKEYYVKEVNTYEFNDDVEFLCDIYVQANIKAWHIKANIIKSYDIKAFDIKAENINTWDINARNIDVWNIDALNITANNITAKNISYFAVCVAYDSIHCNSIKGIRKNAKHFVLDGKLVVKGRNKI